MVSVLHKFDENILRCRDLGTLASAITSITTTALDVADMWRAQIVLGVSALDHFVHELSRIGMVETAKGARAKTDAYRRFQLPLSAVERAMVGESPEEWMSDAVREKHTWLSFQQPDKIADAIRLISSVKLWEEVGKELQRPASDVKLQLELIIDRRNKIAHEADMDPTNPGFRWPITDSLAADSITFIEMVGHAIFKVAV